VDAHRTGHPAYVIMYPVLDFTVVASNMASAQFHSPACEASTQPLVGLYIIP